MNRKQLNRSYLWVNMRAKEIVKRVPILAPVSRKVKHTLFPEPFPGSERYWIERYATGGDSGVGSHNKLAQFKAEVLNDFVWQNNVKSVIEYGCGDGNQLKLAEYPFYIGFDVSSVALARCDHLFHSDRTKSFRLTREYAGERAELTLSLDVISITSLKTRCLNRICKGYSVLLIAL
jgi:hypothetical protein